MTTQKTAIRTKHDPAIILAIVLAIFCVLRLWHRSEQCFGLDFYQFWVAGQEIRKAAPVPVYTDAWRIGAGERYYQAAHAKKGYRHEMGASDIRRVLQTYSTPLLYSFFSLIDTADYDQSLKHYQIISFACGIAAIGIMCRLLRFSWVTTLLMIAALFGWGEAYLSEVFCANVNQVQFFAISCLMWIEMSRGRDSRQIVDGCTGALLALIVLFKPNVAAIAGLLGVMWLMDRSYARFVRVAISFAITTMIVIVVTSMRIGFSHCWIDWLQSVHQLEQQSMTPQGENYSLAAVALARGGSVAARIVSVMAPVVAFAVFAMRRSGRDSKQWIRAVAIGAALSLLASPFAWLHYFVLLTPLVLVALRPGTSDESVNWSRVRIALGIFSLVMICDTPLMTDLLGTAPFYASIFASRSIRMAGVAALLFIFTLGEFWRDSLPRWPGLSFGVLAGKVFRRNVNVAS